MIKSILTYIGFIAFFLLFADMIVSTLCGFVFNPFTDSGFHTVVNVYRYKEDPWTKLNEVSITGTVWHDINIKSQKEVGTYFFKYYTGQERWADSVIEREKAIYYKRGEELIKTVK